MSALLPCPFCGRNGVEVDGEAYCESEVCPAGNSFCDADEWNTRSRTPLEAELIEALRPFSEMTGELFARNYNKTDVVLRFNPPDAPPVLLTFEDFLRLRDLITRANTRPKE